MTMDGFLEKNKTLLRYLLPVVAALLLFLPGYFFFSNRGGASFLEGASFRVFAALIFPLFGLYAFTLIWLQIMIGSNMRFLIRIWPKALLFHQFEGMVAFLFVLTHVSLIIITYTFEQYLGARFLPKNLQIYGILGSFAFYFIILSTTAALFRKTSFLRKFWRKVHYLNYSVFFLVLIHSWNLGSDVQPSLLKYLWYFYGATVTLSLGAKIILRPNWSLG